MDLDAQLESLKQSQAELKETLGQRRKEFLALQREKQRLLKNQIRRAQTRISAADRKRRTRRLILMGSYIEHRAQADPAEHDRLMQGLADFLERDQDRALFDLPANKETAAAAADSLPGWRPHRLPSGEWGAIYHGDTSTLPTELVGTPITVQAKNGQRWTATVTAVLDRSRDQVLITDSGRPASP